MPEQLNQPIKSAVIVSKVYKRPLSGAIRELAARLTKLGVDTYLEQSTAVGFNIGELKCLSRRGMGKVDLIIVVGGDG